MKLCSSDNHYTTAPPFNDKCNDNNKSNRDKSILGSISEKINVNDFCDPISLEDFLHPNKIFPKKLKNTELGEKTSHSW